MVAWPALLLPALIAAVLVFIASSLIHMVLRLHKPDYRQMPGEDEVRAVLRRTGASPGQYMIPYCNEPKDMASPEHVKKLEEGPIGVVYVGKPGVPSLGPFLGKWFAYSLVVSLLAGYVARAAVPPGAAYLSVFQVVGAASWLAYGWQGPQDSIWMCKPWSVTLRHMRDGLVYAALTAGAYAWLWPSS
jgi:hypothetical protein